MGSEEESGKDWSELEEEAAKGRLETLRFVMVTGVNGVQLIRSVIVPVINKIGRPRGWSLICSFTSMTLQTELDDTKFCYQVIITITKFVRGQK